ncbi:MAG TPA: hypothetical protein VN228_21300 [Pyrinomonadaceae bacterium]|nr:hypothetical protein [Pyrinomonadaceae bacterium]
MTPADHNKVLGIMHLIYGGFFTLVSLLVLLFFGFFAGVMSAVAANDPNAPPAALFWALMVLVFLLYLMLSLPGLVAGYAMLKRKSWARIAGIVAAVVAGMSFPFGTALCVYTFWFCFSKQGEAFERERGADADRWRGSLNQGQPLGGYAQTFGHEREPAYRPPAQPPDWRGE